LDGFDFIIETLGSGKQFSGLTKEDEGGGRDLGWQSERLAAYATSLGSIPASSDTVGFVSLSLSPSLSPPPPLSLSLSPPLSKQKIPLQEITNNLF